jgi:serine protease Do
MKFLLNIPLLMSVLFSPLAAEENIGEKISQSFREIAKKAVPAVVSVKVEYGANTPMPGEQEDLSDLLQEDFFRRFFGDPRHSPFGGKKQEPTPRFGQGSGFIVSKDGVIITNNHVIQDTNKIIVQLNDGREFDAKVLGADPQSDVAVIKIESNDLPFLTLGDSSKLEMGDLVFAIGNPLSLQSSMTQGIVSATGRANLDIASFEDFIQTDAAINRGNSGGPLVNYRAEVIGINTAIASNTGGYMGIGFAIPSNMAKEIMRQIVETGHVVRGFLGVSLQPITSDLAQAFGLNRVEGALVADVSPDSPASYAGLERGDIIVGFNGKRIESITAFRNQVALMAPGTEVRLEIKRGNEMKSLSLMLGTHPENDDKKGGETASTTLGISVETLTPELAKTFAIQDEEGVVVTKVDPRGQAATLGIKRGALIMAVNQKKVTTPEGFRQAIAKKDERGGVLLLIKQEGAVRYIYIRGK